MTPRHNKAMISALRQFYSRYWYPKKEVLEDAKVKVPMLKKDGTKSRRYTISWRCERCKETTTKPVVHHNPPIGDELLYPFNLKEFVQYVSRLLCNKEQLMCLCKSCHKDVHKELRDEN